MFTIAVHFGTILVKDNAIDNFHHSEKFISAGPSRGNIGKSDMFRRWHKNLKFGEKKVFCNNCSSFA